MSFNFIVLYNHFPEHFMMNELLVCAVVNGSMLWLVAVLSLLSAACRFGD